MLPVMVRLPESAGSCQILQATFLLHSCHIPDKRKMHGFRIFQTETPVLEVELSCNEIAQQRGMSPNFT